MATNTTYTSASNSSGVTSKKKTSKRRMKKQVRRTLGGLFLASAIAVAAIPVEPTQAGTVKDGEMSHLEDPTDANDTYTTNIVRSIHYNDSANSSYENISGINATESWKSKVPFVDTNETIYVDASKQFLFAYIPESATATNKIAVLLGVQNMVGNSLTIPDTVETYLQYNGNTTTGGYCAVNMNGDFLYYSTSAQESDPLKGKKYTSPIYAQKDPTLVGVLPVMVPNAGGLDTLSLPTSQDVWEKGDSSSYNITTVPTSLSADDGVIMGSMTAGQPAYSYTYAEFKYDSTTPNPDGSYNGQWVTKTAYVPLDPVMKRTFQPCYLDNKSTWCPGGIDEPLYTWEGGDPIVLTDVNSFDPIEGKGEEFQRVEAVVKYIGMQRVEASTYDVTVTPDPSKPDETQTVQLTKWTVTEPTTTTGAGGVLKETPTNGVFYGTGIRELTIGERLEGIGDYAFYGCTSLASITLSENLNTIGNGAFKGCYNLQDISLNLWSKISIIGASAFESCRQLKNFYLPTSVKIIGDRAFKGCTALQHIYMCGEDKDNGNAISPDISMALEKIGYNAFVNDSALEYLEFGKDFQQQLPVHYFAGCTGLSRIKANNSYFDIIDGDIDLDDYPTNASGKKYAWDEGGKGEKYYHHDELGHSCDIDDWLKSLDDENFYFEACDSYALHTTAKDHSAAFLYDDGGYKDDYEIVLRCKETPYHENTFIVDTNDKLVNAVIDPACSEITIPDSIGGHGVSIIDSSCFAENCSLKKLFIPGTVQEIQTGAFKGCHNLNTVIFTGSEQELETMHIADGAFKTQDTQCGHTLETTPKLSFVGPLYSSSDTNKNTPFDYAMRYTNNINNGGQTKDTYITYYSGWPTFLQVQYHPDRAGTGKKYSGNNLDDEGDENELVAYPTISYLSAMAEAYIASPADAYEKYPFMTEDDFKDLLYVYRGEGSDAPAWQNPDFPAGYTADQVICADSINELVLPIGVESIKSGLFSNLDSDGKPVDDTLLGTTGKGLNYLGANNVLKAVELNTVKSIEPYAFAGLQNLKTVNMVGGEEIGDYAFFGDSALENVSLSGYATKIGIRPFRDCTALETVSFNGSSYFTCEDAIIYGLSGGNKASIIECLETRGQNIGGVFNGAKTVTADGTITSIRPEAFMNCDKVTTVDLSAATGLDRIPERTFAAMDSLQTVRLPEELSSIGTDAFLDTPTDGMLISIPGAMTMFDDNYIFGQTKHGRSFEATLYDEFLAGYHSDDFGDVYDAADSTASAIKDENNPYIDNDKVSRDITFECPEKSAATNYAKTGHPYINATASMQQFKVNFWDAQAIDPDTPYDTQTVNSGECAENPKYDPSHDGMQFKGWGLNSVTVVDVENNPITANTDYYAIYDGGMCTVIFRLAHAGERETIFTDEVQYGSAATAPDDLKHYDGYTYQTDANGLPKWVRDPESSETGMRNITDNPTYFTLNYDPVNPSDKHHVVFYNYDDTIVSEQDVADGEAAKTPSNPYREGYTFTGWKPADFTNVTKDMDIYAQYEKNASGGGGGGGGGGSSSGNSGGNKSSSGNSSSGNSSNAKTYTVTVINGSGSGTYAEGSTVVIAANDPAKGKAFDKWTTADASLASTTLSATTFKMPGKNVTVTANYKDAPSSSSGTVKYATGNSARPTATGRTATGSTQVQVNKGGVSNVDLASATVRGSTDSFIVKVTETNEATNLVENALNNRFGGLDALKYWPCDISLYDSTGNTKITDTTGLTVEITLPIPDELRQYGGNNKVAAVSNGQLEDLGTRFNTVNGTPTVTFTATHFSPYVIYADTNNLVASEMLDASPKTGDPIHPKWFLAIALAAGSVFMFLKKDKKPAVAAA